MKLKKFASIGALIALLVSAAFIAGCKQDANSCGGSGSGGLIGGGGNGDNVANPFIGTWETNDGLYRMVFDASTVTLYYRENRYQNWMGGGSRPYSVSGNRATPQGTGGEPYIFTVSGNTLSSTGGQVYYRK